MEAFIELLNHKVNLVRQTNKAWAGMVLRCTGKWSKAKSIDSDQLAQTAQADQGRHFLQTH